MDGPKATCSPNHSGNSLTCFVFSGRITADKTQPTGIRVRLGLLLAYLAFPFDPIPDFIPLLGYADDAIVVTWTLRSVAQRIGINQLRHHWPGTEDGFQALCRLTGLGKD